ncbi:MAG: DinB family protein [Chitinophagaceae bacterium]|nr:DinB family protein [Chitinophagaceae bacterium]
MKKELVPNFLLTHQEIIEYVDALDETQFMRSEGGKWTAGQQICHLFLCLQTISNALVSKQSIVHKFGTLERSLMNYDQVVAIYKEGLANGGKAQDRFLPPPVSVDERFLVRNSVRGMLQLLQLQLQNFSDEELDTIVLPHPFLGRLSIRELIYLMTFHATHHLEQIRRAINRN